MLKGISLAASGLRSKGYSVVFLDAKVLCFDTITVSNPVQGLYLPVSIMVTGTSILS